MKHVEKIASVARARDIRVAAAESLTSGLIASRLGAGPEASEWFAGSVVAYRPEVKFELLGVDEGPLVRASCAEQMARGAVRLLGAAVAVAVTGVGGPDAEEGEPPGTVYVAVVGPDILEVRRLDLAGDDPERILDATANGALRMLADVLEV